MTGPWSGVTSKTEGPFLLGFPKATWWGFQFTEVYVVLTGLAL